MPLLTPHFDLAELTVTQQVDGAGRLLANQPLDAALVYLQLLTERLLEPIRDLWGCPVHVLSGYRGPAVERAVQEHAGLILPGAPLVPSQHLLGQAADVVPGDPEITIQEAYRRIAVSSLPYDQLLLEGQPGHEWIHVSTAPVMFQPRREALVSPTGRVPWLVYQPPAAPGGVA